jgi:hypothetical protein
MAFSFIGGGGLQKENVNSSYPRNRLIPGIDLSKFEEVE